MASLRFLLEIFLLEIGEADLLENVAFRKSRTKTTSRLYTIIVLEMCAIKTIARKIDVSYIPINLKAKNRKC